MINPGITSKFPQYELWRYRVDRALAWTECEGSELGWVVTSLAEIWSLGGIGTDEQLESIIAIMEDFALSYAQDLIDDIDNPNFDQYEIERPQTLKALRKVRQKYRN